MRSQCRFMSQYAIAPCQVMRERNREGVDSARRPMSIYVGANTFRESAVEEWARLSLSPRTQASYRIVARAFRIFLRAPLVEASVTDVRRWRDRLIEDGKKLGTVRHHLTVLRSLFKHLERE